MNDLKMLVYNHSPIWMQNILTTIQGSIYKKQRYGKAYYSYISKLNERNYSDYSVQKRYQDEKFVQFVRYAFTHSPFYKDYYASVNFEEIKRVEDIVKLPILPKEVVRQKMDSLYTIPFEKGIISNTSGTTGTSMKFLYTHEDIQRRIAYLDFFKSKHGFISQKMRRASFNSAKIVPPNQQKKIFWRDNWAIKQRIYSGFHCKEENIMYYIENLNKYKPESIDGYPSAIFELSRYIVDHNISLTFTPVAIFPTAETLLPHYRKTIEKAFGCPVRDQYASSEGAPFITECICGKLHYNLDTGIIEVDEQGEMIITCFETHGTPLIRYKIGDRVIMNDSNIICECGSSHPVVHEIQGRGNDYILTKSNGRITSVYLSLVSENFLNSVKNMQYIQNNLDEIDILLEVDYRYKPEMNDIIYKKLEYSLGKDMKFNIHFVDGIPKEPNGKYRLVKNNIMDKK